MQPQTKAEAEIQPQQLESGTAAPWSPAKRVGFRFLFSYFVLFFLTGQEIHRLPFSAFLIRKYTELWHSAAVWIGKNLFEIPYEILLEGQGSGDTTFRWILLPCYVTLASVLTVLWSVLDKRRTGYEKLHQWFRLLLRFSLGLAMITYGISKVIPNQMPAPFPFTLSQRVGELTPMRLLWTFMGASPAYETFTGLAELLGGVLLLVPRTTLLGALVCIADMIMVFMLNLCYDVPVKIMSFHYLLMGLILVAPDLRRLADLFLFNRIVKPAEAPPLSARPWLNRAPHIVFFLFGLYVIGVSFHGSYKRYVDFNGAKPPLYGVWSVEEFAADGKDVPLFTDPDRWRWVIFQRSDMLIVEHMIGSRKSHPIGLDMKTKTMKIGQFQRDREGNAVMDAEGWPRKASGWRTSLSFHQPEADALVLEGQWDGRRTRMKLRKLAVLTGKNFHWITDPFDE